MAHAKGKTSSKKKDYYKEWGYILKERFDGGRQKTKHLRGAMLASRNFT